jgi:predicted MFS family arabinose efflux permease
VSAAGARGRWLALTAAFLGWLFDGFEMGLFPVVARPALKDMLGSAGDGAVGQWMGWITATFLVGAAAGGAAFGWLGDRVGRVRAMTWSILTYSLFSGAAYFAQEPWHLAALRFIAALGMGGEWALGVALVMECWPERRRPWLAGAIGAAANVGMLLVGFVARLWPVTPESWRWMFLVGAAPAVLTFFIRLFVPESERWQAAVRAERSHPVREIFGSPLLLRRTALGLALASVALIGTWGSVQWIPLWADQLTHGRDPNAKAMTQMMSSFGAVFGSLLAPVFGGMISRRLGYSGLCLLSLAVCGWLFRGFDAYGGAFLGLVFLVGCMTAAFYGWFPLYFPELFPTRVRATGQGICFNFGRIFAAAGAVTSGQLVSFYDGSYARMGATVTLVYLVGLVVIWLAPETNGKPMPE